MKKIHLNKKPANLAQIIALCQNKTDYIVRLKGVELLSKYPCYESKKQLYELMVKDRVYVVKEQAFRALQNFGEPVKLPKKKKGKLIKDIQEKLLKVHNKFNFENYSIIDFKIKFQETYPEAYDIYQYDKKEKFDDFILNVIKCTPKKKMKYQYEIEIKFLDTNIPINKSKDIEYKSSNGSLDKLIIVNNLVTLKCERTSNIDLTNIISNEQNTIHIQIIKALIYYYLNIGRYTEILEINLTKIKKSNSTNLNLPNELIQIKQVLANNYSFANIFSEIELEDLFKNDNKSVALTNSLTFLLKAVISTETNDRFEKLWKCFNAIYSYFGNGVNENECQIAIRKFIIQNKTDFIESVRNISAISVTELRDKIRFRDLILNDYPTKNHTVSYIAFLYRYDNWKLNKIFKETLPYREKYLKEVTTIDKVEKKFNNFSNIASIYHANKTNPNTEAIYTEVVNHLDANISNTTTSNDIDIVMFICIKYAYYLRNKIFHAEKQDLTFRFANNNFIMNLDWINGILQNLLIELIKTNKRWP